MNAYSASRSFDPKSYGFTLIELLVVLAIIAMLATLALPKYFHSIDRSKEVILKQNLETTRETIDKFYGDTGRYPNSLDELVAKNYFRKLPFDPITESNSTWVIIPPEDASKGGVYNIKSAATGTGQDGIPYSEF